MLEFPGIDSGGELPEGWTQRRANIDWISLRNCVSISLRAKTRRLRWLPHGSVPVGEEAGGASRKSRLLPVSPRQWPEQRALFHWQND